MVLESIIKPSEMERKPSEMLLVGFVYSTIGLGLALFIFGDYSSIASVFLTAMPLVVIMYKTLRLEEKKDLRIQKERWLIKEHEKAVSMFIFLFIGMVVSYSFWFTILPEDIGSELFSFQINTIKSINPQIIGGIYLEDTIYAILVNNFSVLIFCILFSFIYGAGAILILTINASVIGVAIGNLIRNSIADYASLSHLELIYNYFKSFPLSFAYAIHGIPEITAYFLGALGGGIISVAVVNHDLKSDEFRRIIVDSFDLIILSALLLFLAGLLEVFVTPLLF